MAAFRERLRSGAPMLGSFLKLPSTQGAEIAGGLGFDFAVIDEEHAALNPETTDTILLACRASGLAGVVRVRAAGDILRALDCGAAGVMLPHVTSAAEAAELVALCRYAGGRRGYSPTTRAGGFGGLAMAAQIAAEDRRVAAIAMIEDAAAVDAIDEIVSVAGLDAIFIGRGDLAVSTGGDVAAAAMRVMQAASRAGLCVMIMPAGPTEAVALQQQGASAFIVGSDQGFLRQAAKATRDDYLPALAGKE